MLQIGSRVDQYEIKQLIAETPQSKVFLCSQSDHKGVVALKSTKNKDTPLFYRQVIILRHLQNHSNVVELLSASEYEQYFIMPYFPQNMAQYLSVRGQTISLDDSISCVTQLLQAAQHIHELGVLHLDIKPQNILVSDDKTWVLSDFDAAHVTSNADIKDLTSNYSETVKLKVATAYASPEYKRFVYSNQTDSDELGAHSDIYSIGMLWMRLLENNPNLDSSDVELAITRLPEYIPQWVKGLILSMLQADIAMRVGDAKHCLNTINANISPAEQFDTLEPDDTPIFSEQALVLKKHITQILLVDGELNPQEYASFNEHFKRLSNDTELFEDDEHSVKSIHQLGFDEWLEFIKQQLIAERNLGSWFAWIEYISSLHVKGLNQISDMQFRQTLQTGRASRPDDPSLADAVMLAKFGKQRPVSWLRKKYVWSMILVLCVFSYWLWINQISSIDDVSNQNHLSKSDEQALIWRSDQASENAPNDSTRKNQESIFVQDSPILEHDSEKERGELVEHTLGILPKSVEEHQLDKRITIDAFINQLNTTGKSSLAFHTPHGELEIGLVKISDEHTFAVMTSEVNNQMFEHCVLSGVCKAIESVELAKYPVVNVSWLEIVNDFLPWLNQYSPLEFELMTLSQWHEIERHIPYQSEYTINCKDCRVFSNHKHIGDVKPPLPKYKLDKGLYHLYGNVQEWLFDCWSDFALDEANRIRTQRCDQAFVVGGSWLNNRVEFSSLSPSRLLKHASSPTTGFRLIINIDE